MSRGGDLWFFDRIAWLYDRFMFPADASVLRRGLDRAERPVERVIDLAGGTGRASAALDGAEVVVLDASLPMLRQVDGSGAVVAGDAAGLPLPDESADAMLLVDAAHHLPDLDAVFAEAARVLRPGGVLVVREFDPGTVRGRGIAVGERLVRMGSTFRRPAAFVDHLERAGLDAAVTEEGWIFTVVGVRPEGSAGEAGP